MSCGSTGTNRPRVEAFPTAPVGETVAQQNLGTVVGDYTTEPGERIAHYKVASGDTIWEIARNEGSSIAKIKAANKLTSDRIFPDQLLLVPTSTPDPAAAIAAPAPVGDAAAPAPAYQPAAAASTAPAAVPAASAPANYTPPVQAPEGTYRRTDIDPALPPAEIPAPRPSATNPVGDIYIPTPPTR